MSGLGVMVSETVICRAVEFAVTRSVLRKMCVDIFEERFFHLFDLFRDLDTI